MTGGIARRDLLRFLGGSAIGVMLTPVPWKLTDDLSIWTQNWSWIPKLPRGAITAKHTTCDLCPAACGVRAQCVNGRPFYLAGVPGHPLSGGVLCPAGIGGHHLSFHPRRLAGPVARRRIGGVSDHVSVDAETVLAAFTGAISATKAGGGAARVAILDPRPGRMISDLYRRILSEIPNGLYVPYGPSDERSLSVLEEMMERRHGTLGYDLRKTRTILSFGAPLLDGWCGPGGVLALSGRRSGERRRPTVIQVETRPSRTALLSDRWLRSRPGTAAALALGLAHVILSERWHDEGALRGRAVDFETRDRRDYVRLVRSFTPERVAGITGIRPDILRKTAKAFALEGPSIAVGGGDPGGGPLRREEEIAIQGLNLLVGSVGREGGILLRRALPSPEEAEGVPAVEESEIHAVEDGSIDVLLIDGAPFADALPWSLLERKLARDRALCVSLSSHLTGLAARADYVVASPGYLESIGEVITPPGSARAAFSLSVPLRKTLVRTVEPAEWMGRVASRIGIALPPTLIGPDLLRSRVRAIHENGRGSLFRYADGSVVPVAAVGSAEDLWDVLEEGGCWIDSAGEERTPPRFRLLGSSKDGFGRLQAAAGPPGPRGEEISGYPLAVMLFGTGRVAGGGPVSPLFSKLYEESSLYPAPGSAVMNPRTGMDWGLDDGAPARIVTPAGSIGTIVTFDEAAMPGVVHVAVGPGPDQLGRKGERSAGRLLDLIGAGEDGTWNLSRARVEAA